MSKHEINVDWKETAERLLQSNRRLEKLLADDPVREAFDRACPDAGQIAVVRFDSTTHDSRYGMNPRYRLVTLTFRVYDK